MNEDLCSGWGTYFYILYTISLTGRDPWGVGIPIRAQPLPQADRSVSQIARTSSRAAESRSKALDAYCQTERNVLGSC